MSNQLRISLSILCGLFAWLPTLLGQGTSFNYQGSLVDRGAPANNVYDLTFGLFDAATGGNQLGTTFAVNDRPVSNGVFSVTLDFGGNFPGANRFLQVGVRLGNSTGAYTALSPRQPILAVPYAITASNVSGPIASSQLTGALRNTSLSGTYSGPLIFNNVANSFVGNGEGVTDVNAVRLEGLPSSSFWKTGGNTGVNATSGGFLGTTDDAPLEFRVNGQRVLRLEPNLNVPNVIGGSASNHVIEGIYGATIVGGGSFTDPNVVGGIYASVLSGFGNLASGPSSAAMGQTVRATGYASVAMGYYTEAAGFLSQAAGNQAKAVHDGTFVWGDNRSDAFSSTAANQFLIRAGGGVGINTNNPHGAALAVNGNITATGVISGNGSGLTGLSLSQLAGNVSDGSLSANVALRKGGNTFIGNQIIREGRLGLNVSKAQAHLHVASEDNPTVVRIQSAATGGMGRLEFFSRPENSPNEWRPGFIESFESTDFTGGLRFFVNGSGPNNKLGSIETMRLLDGNVGIGILGAPQARLDVFGGEQGDALLVTCNDSTGFGAGIHVSKSTPGGYGILVQSGLNGTALAARATGPSGWAGSFSGNVSVEGVITGNGGVTEGFEAIGSAAGYGLEDRATAAAGRWSMYALDGRLRFYGAGEDQMSIDGSGKVSAKIFNGTSDRNAKQDFKPIDCEAVLAKVVGLPIQSWAFKSDPAIQHVGPMAQDFYAAFEVGADDKHIATVDAEGVALAAIQGLNKLLQAKNEKITELERRLEKLERASLHSDQR